MISEAHSQSRLRNSGGIDERRQKRYRDILISNKNDSPSPSSPTIKKKLELKTEGLLSIIKNCESLRDSYRNSQDEWRGMLEKE